MKTVGDKQIRSNPNYRVRQWE
jgi:hypothetical protein